MENNKHANNSFLKMTIFVSALVLCLWTTTFTLIANFAPSGAAGKRYYCEIDSAEVLPVAIEEINALTTNTSSQYSAIIKLTNDIEVTNKGVEMGDKSRFYPSGILNTMSTAEEDALNKPIAFVTLDLNGHVFHMSEYLLDCQKFVNLEIIDSNPTAENTLPNGEKITGGAIYGDENDTGNSIQIGPYSHVVINGGNYYGSLGFFMVYSDLTINQGVIKCNAEQALGIEIIPSSVVVFRQYMNTVCVNHVYINGGQIDYPIVAINSNGTCTTSPTILAKYVKVDESKVTVKKDDAGKITGYEEKAVDPDDPNNPSTQEPNDNKNTDDNKNPDDNKTPVISGTTDNGQPTSEDFMKIMMIGVLVIAALSMVSVMASLLVVIKRRLRMA